MIVKFFHLYFFYIFTNFPLNVDVNKSSTTLHIAPLF